MHRAQLTDLGNISDRITRTNLLTQIKAAWYSSSRKQSINSTETRAFWRTIQWECWAIINYKQTIIITNQNIKTTRARELIQKVTTTSETSNILRIPIRLKIYLQHKCLRRNWLKRKEEFASFNGNFISHFSCNHISHTSKINNTSLLILSNYSNTSLNNIRIYIKKKNNTIRQTIDSFKTKIPQ